MKRRKNPRSRALTAKPSRNCCWSATHPFRGDAAMTRKLLTIDEFRDSAKAGKRPEGTVVRLATADPEVDADQSSRTIRFVFSDGTVDRAGDSIDPNGWEIDTFLDNPV